MREFSENSDNSWMEKGKRGKFIDYKPIVKSNDCLPILSNKSRRYTRSARVDGVLDMTISLVPFYPPTNFLDENCRHSL